MAITLQTIQAMTIDEIVSQIGELGLDMSTEVWRGVLVKVWVEGNEGQAKQFLSNMFDSLKNQAERREDKGITLCGKSSSAGVVEATNRACTRVAAIWKDKNTQNAKRKEESHARRQRSN